MPCNDTTTESPLKILETTQMETTQVYDYVNLAANVHFFFIKMKFKRSV